MALPAGWTTTTSDNGTITVQRDPAIAEQVADARAGIQDTRNKVVDLYNQVAQTYTGLVNAGRQEEAASLRDAAERFARAGSQTGVSSDVRVASLQELAGSLRVAGQKAESQIEAQGINQTLDILQTLAGMDQAVLSDSFRDAYGQVSSSSSSSRSPLAISGIKNTRSNRSPLSTGNAQQRMMESRSRSDSLMQSFLDRVELHRQQRITADATASARNYADQLRSNQLYADTSRINEPTVGADAPRQWGEKLVSQQASSRRGTPDLAPSGGQGAVGASPLPVGAPTEGAGQSTVTTPDGKTLIYDPYTSTWGESDPRQRVAATKAKAINQLPTGGGFTIAEGFKRLPSDIATGAFSPVTAALAGAEKGFDWLRGNPSQTFKQKFAQTNPFTRSAVSNFFKF